MPLYLIRQDLTTMDCDAIVNPSNVHLQPGGGLDAAIHKAAGPSLMKACRDAAPCPVGQAKATQAFRLPCKWVIHTAAPVWRGGLFGELNLLASCYRSSVACAQELHCTTLAVPLLGAGSNGIPAEKVLPLALRTLETCLSDTEMTVYLVVYSKDAFAISKRVRADVQSYIDDHYVETHPPKRAGSFSKRLTAWAERNFYVDGADDAQVLGESEDDRMPDAPYGSKGSGRLQDGPLNASMSVPAFGAAGDAAAYPMASKRSDVDFLLQLDEPFAVKLLKLIDRKQMDDVTCYKKANVSRQTWYKIINEKGYKPNKKTVLSFAVALELTLEETQMLLESVGFVLSNSSLFDVIVMYCLSHAVYNVAEIDALLFKYDQETLYSKA